MPTNVNLFFSLRWLLSAKQHVPKIYTHKYTIYSLSLHLQRRIYVKMFQIIKILGMLFRKNTGSCLEQLSFTCDLCQGQTMVLWPWGRGLASVPVASHEKGKVIFWTCPVRFQWQENDLACGKAQCWPLDTLKDSDLWLHYSSLLFHLSLDFSPLDHLLPVV